MVRIYIIRHGETEPNTRFACLGLKDVSLNENGKAQAEKLCFTLKDVMADAVYVSPLKRAYETIEPYCNAHPQIPVITENGITERDFGDWDDMSFDEIKAADPVRYSKWQEDFINYPVPNGESSASVQERVNSSIAAITAENEGKTIFLVTHLGTARHILSRCLGLNTEQSWRFTLNNASYAVIDYDNNAGYGVLKHIN